MRKIFGCIILASFLSLCATSCKEPFNPEVKNKGVNLLVVEGTIFDGSEITSFKLTRTADLSDGKITPESKAVVIVEGEENDQYVLTEVSSGTYSARLNALKINKNYRLRIKAAGKEYLSAFVPLKNTPDVDQIVWQKNPAGVAIGVNTHDPENNTRYYRWQFEHTWEFHSSYVSPIDYVNGVIKARPNYMDIYRCWKTENSALVLVGSSANLSRDVISNFKLVNIPPASWQLSVLYSILVKQFAMTEEEFKYWQKIKKNTEDLGSIFDPQPSEIPGNITCVSAPEEPVIGFVGACVPKQKRIFISPADVSPWLYSQHCNMFDVKDDPDSLRAFFLSDRAEPLERYTGQDGKFRYTGAESDCVDCTLRGTNVKPSFWP